MVESNIKLQQPWDTLRLLVLYRILLALVFSSLFSFGFTPFFVEANYAVVFTTVSLLYSLFAFIFFIAWFFKYPKFFTQTFWQLALDVIFINLIIFATGKNGIGLAALLIIPVTIASYTLTQNYALFIAAIASVALTLFSYSLYGNTELFAQSYTQHVIISALLFALVLIFTRLATKARTVQIKLHQQSKDLKNLELINQQVMDTLKSGVVIVDKKHNIKSANHAAMQYLNLSQNKYLPGSVLKKEFNSWLHTPFSHSIVYQEEENNDTPKLRAKFEPFANNWTMIVLDEISVINEELQQLKLSSLGRLTASIAHEIRNPLSSINQAAQLIEESTTITQADKKLTQIIQKNTHRMNTMVEKITQLSKKQHFKQETIKLLEFLNLFKYEFCLTDTLKEEQIIIETDNELATIQFDSIHLNQIFWNLCSNSIKHGQINPAEVKINISIQTHNNHLTAIYTDNGQGITNENKESIFEPFYTNSSNGSGLGLYISKELCNLNQTDLIYIPTATGCRFKIIFFLKGNMHESTNNR